MHQYPELPSSAFARQLRKRLLAWFRRTQRDLPWRHDRDPYRIWVSEVMLQQTQVATVISYYQRFLEAFPSVAALAAASEQDVLRLWEGLGYYRRARDLHRAAREMVDRHNGQVPHDPAALADLQGIGRYSVGAILSQAFDQRLPIVEANSLRVLCRWFACADNPRSGAVQRWLWEAAEALLPRRGVGEFNQALMELGALVCTPTKPSCLLCPVAALCAARARGIEGRVPRRAKPATATAIREAAVVIRKGETVLLAQRPADAARWAGLWEFPHGPLTDGETDAAAAERVIRELTGLRTTLGPMAGAVRHGITRFQVSMACFIATYRGGRFRSSFYAAARWVRLEELSRFPLSSPQRQLAKRLPEFFVL